jgi:uncharacterized protein (DUF3820 family)
VTERLSNKDPMPCGKFKGKPMSDVPASHLLDIAGQYWISKYPGLKGVRVDHE